MRTPNDMNTLGKIMRQIRNTLRRSLLASASGVLLAATWWSAASATTIDFSAEADTTNPVSTASTTFGDVTLSAITNLPNGGFDLMGGKAGVVYFDNGKGVGVKDSKNNKGKLKGIGKKEISGGGGDKFEALKFTFSSAVDPSTLSFTLGKYKCKSGPPCAYTEDKIAVVVDFEGGGSQDIAELAVEAIFPTDTKNFDLPVIDFSLLTLTDPNYDITMVTIKALDGKFFVKDVTFYPGIGIAGGGTSVPEPATVVLFATGLFGLGYRQRLNRRNER